MDCNYAVRPWRRDAVVVSHCRSLEGHRGHYLVSQTRGHSDNHLSWSRLPQPTQQRFSFALTARIDLRGAFPLEHNFFSTLSIRRYLSLYLGRPSAVSRYKSLSV